MTRGLIRRMHDRLAPSKGQEVLPITNRVVIFGSNLSGAPHFANTFKEFLQEQGISDAEVTNMRDAGYIDDAFYGRNREDPTVKDTVPSAVMAFSEMRQYWDGRGMFVPTPIDYIDGLCRQYGVPLLKETHLTQWVSPEEFMIFLGSLIVDSTSEVRGPA